MENPPCSMASGSTHWVARSNIPPPAPSPATAQSRDPSGAVPAMLASPIPRPATTSLTTKPPASPSTPPSATLRAIPAKSRSRHNPPPAAAMLPQPPPPKPAPSILAPLPPATPGPVLLPSFRPPSSKPPAPASHPLTPHNISRRPPDAATPAAMARVETRDADSSLHHSNRTRTAKVGKRPAPSRPLITPHPAAPLTVVPCGSSSPPPDSSPPAPPDSKANPPPHAASPRHSPSYFLIYSLPVGHLSTVFV